MDWSIWAILLLVVAVLLLFAEVLIPSGGLIFFTSMVCLGFSIYAAWEAWWVRNPMAFWGFIASVVVLLPIAVGSGIYVWPHTPIGRSLEPPRQADVTPYQEETHLLEKLIGQVGETITPLTPGGLIRIAGQRIHATSEGPIIEAGLPVRACAVQGLRLVVRETHASASIPAPAPWVLDENEVRGESPPLDFELPHS